MVVHCTTCWYHVSLNHHNINFHKSPQQPINHQMFWKFEQKKFKCIRLYSDDYPGLWKILAMVCSNSDLGFCRGRVHVSKKTLFRQANFLKKNKQVKNDTFTHFWEDFWHKIAFLRRALYPQKRYILASKAPLNFCWDSQVKKDD